MNPFADLNAYDLRHLVGHLTAARKDRAVHRLLALSTDDGHHAWFEAKEGIRDVPGFLEDLASASNRTANAPDDECAKLLDVRYALIRASISSVAQSVPPTLVDLACKHDIWTTTRALTFAGMIPDPTRRFRTLLLLSQRVEGGEQTRALWAAFDAAKRMSQDYERIDALLELLNLNAVTHQTTVVHQLLLEAVNATNGARTMTVLERVEPFLEPDHHVPALRAIAQMDEFSMIPAMRHVAPHLSDELLLYALDAGYRSAEWVRWTWLQGLAPYLPEAGLRQGVEAMASILRTADDVISIDASSALGGFAAHLSPMLQHEALELTGTIPRSARAAWLWHLVPRLENNLMPQARELAQTLTDDPTFAHFFPSGIDGLRRSDSAALSSDKQADAEPANEDRSSRTLSEAEWQEAIQEILKRDTWDRLDALTELLGTTTGPLPTSIVDLLVGNRNSYKWLELVSAAAPRLQNSHINTLIAYVPELVGQDPAAFGLDERLTDIAQYMTKPVAAAAVAAASGVRDQGLRDDVLIRLIPSLPDEQASVRAQEMLERVDADPDFVELLFPLLPNSHKHTAFEQLRTANNLDERMVRLSRAPDSIPATLVEEFLVAALDLDKRSYRWRILIAFLDAYPPAMRPKLHDELLRAGAKLEDTIGQWAVERLYSHLDAARADRYLRVLRGGGAADVADALLAAQKQATLALPDDLSDLSSKEWEAYCTQCTADELRALVDRIERAQVDKRASLLTEIAQYLNEDLATRMLPFAEADPNVWRHVWAVGDLVPRLPKTIQPAVVQRLIDSVCDIKKLTDLQLVLPDLLRLTDYIEPAWLVPLYRHATNIGDPDMWLELAPHLPEDEAVEAVTQAVTTLQRADDPGATGFPHFADVIPLLTRTNLFRDAFELLMRHRPSLLSSQRHVPDPSSVGLATDLTSRIGQGAAHLTEADQARIWAIMIDVLAQKSRAKLLKRLPGLVGLLGRLGVSNPAAGLAAEIERVGNWWP